MQVAHWVRASVAARAEKAEASLHIDADLLGGNRVGSGRGLLDEPFVPALLSGHLSRSGTRPDESMTRG